MEISDPRARLATLSSAWPWIPPCHVWSTFARRWNCLVVGVCASKVCTQTAFCTIRQALLCSASRDRALVCSGSSCFRRHPSQVINLNTDTLVLLCPLRHPGRAPAEAQCESSQLSRVRTTLVPAAHTASWLCASWSVGTQHIQHRVRSLLANIHPNEPLRNVLCSPSCSSRAAPVALITKSSRLTVLCTLSP